MAQRPNTPTPSQEDPPSKPDLKIDSGYVTYSLLEEGIKGKICSKDEARIYGYLTPPGSPNPTAKMVFLTFARTAPQRVKELAALDTVSDLAQSQINSDSRVTIDEFWDDSKNWERAERWFDSNDWGWDSDVDPANDAATQLKIARELENREQWRKDAIKLAAARRAFKLKLAEKQKLEDKERKKWPKRDLQFQQANTPIPPPPNNGGKDANGNFRTGNVNTKPIASLPRPRTLDQERVHPDAVQPIAGTIFAPPYVSTMLRQRPHLASGLHHVNCSYLTAKTRPRGAGGSGRTFEGYSINADAPTLGELKQHVQSLLYLIKHMGFSTTAAEIDAANLIKQIRGNWSADQSYKNQITPPNIIADTGVFDFLHDLDQEYKPKEAYDKIPLTHLLNTVEWRDSHTDATVNVCPLIRLPAEAISRKQHPMPFTRIESLMEHADSALLMIDDALSASGGLLSALPMNLPADDYRRKTFLGQMIHFMRVMVTKVHTLDKAYGSALDCLAGEATVPKYLKTQAGLLHPEELKTAFAEHQQEYILTNIQPEAYRQIWYEMQKKGAARAENNGYGLYDVYIPTRYRGLVGGKTVFITPDPARIGEGLAGEDRNVERPTVITVRKPGPATDTSEWLRKHTAELEEARMWKQRAIDAEEKVKRFELDVEYLTPEVTLEEVPGEQTRMTATEAWARVTRREESLRLKLLDRSVYAQRNRGLEARNKYLEQENDKLTRWKTYDKLGYDVNERLLKENAQLAGYLKEAVDSWKSRDDELKALRQDIEDRDENTKFEMLQLQDAHQNRVKTLEAQLIVEINKNEKGPEQMNRELAIDKVKLQRQNETLLDILKLEKTNIAKLEDKIRKQPDLKNQLKLRTEQYKTLMKRHEAIMTDWADKYLKFGDARPNDVYRSRFEAEEAGAERDEQKKETLALRGRLHALQARYDNLTREWEDEAKVQGDKGLEQRFIDLRQHYEQELQLQFKIIREREDELDGKKAKCEQEKRSIRQENNSTKDLYTNTLAENMRLHKRMAELLLIADIHDKCPQEKRQLGVEVRAARQEAQRIARKATEIIKEESDKQVTNTAKFVRAYDQLLARYEITLFSFLQSDVWGCDNQNHDEEERQVREKKREMWLREQFAEEPCERLQLGKREEYVHDEIPRAMASRIIDVFALQKKNFVENNKVWSFNQEMKHLQNESGGDAGAEGGDGEEDRGGGGEEDECEEHGRGIL